MKTWHWVAGAFAAAVAAYFVFGGNPSKVNIDQIVRSKKWSGGYNIDKSDAKPGYEVYYSGIDANGFISHADNFSAAVHKGVLLDQNTIEWTNTKDGSKFYWFATPA